MTSLKSVFGGVILESVSSLCTLENFYLSSGRLETLRKISTKSTLNWTGLIPVTKLSPFPFSMQN